MIWLLTTLAALGAAFYIAAPFYRHASLRAPAGAPLRHRQRDLEAQREVLLRELKELEFDRRMGKADEQQYAATRAHVTRQAAQVLRQIEALNSPQTPRRPRQMQRAVPIDRSRLELEIELEVAVARARRRMKSPVASTGWLCSCGRVMLGVDRFCGSCGQERTGEVKSASPPEAAAA